MKLLASLFLASLAQRRLASALSLLAVALGVALGVAVSSVNRSALDEFAHGVRVISGEADLQLYGPRNGFDEALFPRVALLEGVDIASPVLELDVRVAGRDETLKVLGLDLLRAAAIQPSLRPQLARGESRMNVFGSDTVFLSPAALKALGLKQGDVLPLQVGLDQVELRVAGTAIGFVPGQRAALMDIGAAQWRLRQLGRLSRIDLRLSPGAVATDVRAALGHVLPPGVFAVEPDSREAQAGAMSRAYRANLTMLAVIALATGAFLVFATQTLSVVRRQSEFALLRALGVTQGGLLRGVLVEGASIGLFGGLVGLLLGYALAAVALALFGGDLGAGYFAGSRPTLQVDVYASVGFVVLGMLAALGGSLWPALHAARGAPALALRAGHDPAPPHVRGRPVWAVAMLCMATVLAMLPALDELPWGGYAAVACVLASAVCLLPNAALVITSALAKAPGLMFGMARARVAAASSHAVIAAGGVLASVALAVAMAIMVASFRHSVEDWLAVVLPADIYLRGGRSAPAAGLEPVVADKVRSVPGVARVDPIRHEQIRVSAEQLPLALVARPVPAGRAGRVFPMQREVPVTGPAVWISEAVADLHGWQPGQTIALPIGGALHSFQIAGIWRDYARQNGAVLIDLTLYRELTGDLRFNDLAVFAAPDASAEGLRTRLRETLGDRVEIASTEEIRRLSLGLFDRTFAVTYALEACAVLIGLFGIAASFAALAAARRREFGMLRHLGVTRREIGAMLAWEGALVALIGVCAGAMAGGGISVLLIRVVNRQSFHWSMDFAVPWQSLALFALAMLGVSALAAVLAGRSAMLQTAVHAVREDA
ncbi:FtsX-like permease family protein [Niveibacterium umoris]|uniref:Putative ABC transport system permease protein n=1 Tax=Niveibacterium umoris TaxID=1193620 RepID=A0A840BGU9_9RHOO|nr:FtsX-like permease family protein [Niveibacterium umoris]MBB4011434.1 putative ABC transport system permease protein [Niveibacterium umoris]